VTSTTDYYGEDIKIIGSRTYSRDPSTSIWVELEPELELLGHSAVALLDSNELVSVTKFRCVNPIPAKIIGVKLNGFCYNDTYEYFLASRGFTKTTPKINRWQVVSSSRRHAKNSEFNLQKDETIEIQVFFNMPTETMKYLQWGGNGYELHADVELLTKQASKAFKMIRHE
jgi:hypothetical protein